MPPGASILTRGLGMSGVNKYTRDQERGRKDSKNYDRPEFFSHGDDGENYPVPRELHGHKNSVLIPHVGCDTTSVPGKYLDDPRRNAEGLTGSYVDRLFEHERSQWPRLGFTSPYKNDRGRTKRNANEFKLWLDRHPYHAELVKRMDEEYDKGHDSPYYRIDDARRRSGPPVGIGNVDRRDKRERYRQPRDSGIYTRPAYRRRGSIDHQDPQYCPPYPTCDMIVVQGGTDRSPNGIHPALRKRQKQRRHHAIGRSQVPRDTGRSPFRAHGAPGHKAQPQLSPRLLRDLYPRRPRIGTRLIYADYDARNEDSPAFVPQGLQRQRHHPRLEQYGHEEDDDDDDEDDDDDDDDDEEDDSSHLSNISYVRDRLSPEIVPASLPPYNARPSRHGRHNGRYEYDTDEEEEEEEEPYRRRGGLTSRRSGLYGIGREGGRVRVGPRGYEREDLDYGCGFGGDEDDDF